MSERAALLGRDGDRPSSSRATRDRARARDDAYDVERARGEIDADEFIELIARLAENFFDVYFTAIANAESARLHRVSHPGENVLALAPAPRVDDVALAPKLRWFLPRLAAASSSRSVPVH